MDIFIKRLQMLLDENNMSQKELANKVGVTEVTISRYITGERKPRIDIASKIAEVLGTHTDYLMGKSDIKTPYKKTPDNQIIKDNDDEIELTPDEIELLKKIKSDPDLSILFHDLKSAPKKKIKQLLKTWEFINEQFEEMEKELDDED